MSKKNYSEVWNLLEKDFQEFPPGQSGPVPEIEILRAEKTLGCVFDKSYKKFISLYGGAGIPGHYIYGLRRQINMGKESWSVLHRNHFYKDIQQWPGIEDWYVVSDDGSGNPIGIDPKGKVWLSDHDAGFEHIKLANSFEEFLYRIYTDTLYEDLDG